MSPDAAGLLVKFLRHVQVRGGPTTAFTKEDPRGETTQAEAEVILADLQAHLGVEPEPAAAEEPTKRSHHKRDSGE